MRLNVDVIVASAVGAWAARKVTSTILRNNGSPRFRICKEPREARRQHDRVSYAGVELNPKRLERFKEALPHAKRFAALATSKHRVYARAVNELEAAAKSLGVSLQIVDVGEPSSSAIDIALETISKSAMQGVLVL